MISSKSKVSRSQVQENREELGVERNQYENLLNRYGCPLCNEVFINTFATSCRHKFCRRCILKWLRYCRKCPECAANVTKINPLKRIDAEIERAFLLFPTHWRKHRENLKKKRFRAELEWKRMKMAEENFSSTNLDRMKAAEGLRQQIKENSHLSVSVRSRKSAALSSHPLHQPEDLFPSNSNFPPDSAGSPPNSSEHNPHVNEAPQKLPRLVNKKERGWKVGIHNPGSKYQRASVYQRHNGKWKQVEFLKLPPLFDNYERLESTQTSLGSSGSSGYSTTHSPGQRQGQGQSVSTATATLTKLMNESAIQAI